MQNELEMQKEGWLETFSSYLTSCPTCISRSSYYISGFSFFNVGYIQHKNTNPPIQSSKPN